MMNLKYFLDTEFIEGTQKRRGFLGFGKGETLPTIDLISIGITCEDGRSFMALNKEVNLKEAWNRYDAFDVGNEYWLRDNVLRPIYENYKIRLPELHGMVPKFTYKTMCLIFNQYGLTKGDIAKQIKFFCLDGERLKHHDPEFYGYYADYDWVVFCWLFGKMIDLPNSFPMYCMDIRQMIAEVDRYIHDTFRYKLSNDPVRIRMVEVIDGFKNTDRAFVTIKRNANFPTNKHSHDVLSDAKWHQDMYEYVMDVRNQLGIN